MADKQCPAVAKLPRAATAESGDAAPLQLELRILPHHRLDPGNDILRLLLLAWISALAKLKAETQDIDVIVNRVALQQYALVVRRV